MHVLSELLDVLIGNIVYGIIDVFLPPLKRFTLWLLQIIQ